LFPLSLFAQDSIAYAPPLRGPLLVTGTFGELRGDHFHAGLDFRARTGTPVYSVADGYVSRIKVSPGGYGQAIYVDHPDGRRSVYGHLETLAAELLDTVRARQFAQEEFQQDLRFDSLAFPVTRGQRIGGVGNRGHSFGPHLHFEVREIDGDAPVNPLAFGFPIPDTRAPVIRNLRVYGYGMTLNPDGTGTEVWEQTLTPERLRDGSYVIRDTILMGTPLMGFALKTYDRQNGMPNWNGIYGGELIVDSTEWFDFRFDRIPFEQTEYLNALTDYGDWVENESWFHRYWALSPRQFMARPRDAKQVFPIAVDGNPAFRFDSRPTPVTLSVRDYAGNVSELRFVVYFHSVGRGERRLPAFQYFLPAGEASIIDNGDIRLELDSNALYQDCNFRYARLPDRSANYVSDVYQLHDYRTPLHGTALLAISPASRVPAQLKSRVFLGQCDKDGHLSSHGGAWQADGRFAARISTFGDYALFLDTIPPTVEINYFGNDLRRATGFGLIVEDNVSGGRMNYRGTIDGKWVLLELDGKSGKLSYSFENGDPGSGRHTFELEVTDGHGNTTVWQRNFRR